MITKTAMLHLIPKESTIVIEDIEKYFHPSKAHLIVQLLKSVIKERKIDVILSTHSPAFLNEIGGKLVQNVSVVYRNDESGHSEIKKYSDFDDFVRFISKGSLGDVATLGLIEQSIHKSGTHG
jgi:predicted ATP-binding protein involved in virulence